MRSPSLAVLARCLPRQHPSEAIQMQTSPSQPAYAWNYFHFVDRSHDVVFSIIMHEGDIFGQHRQSYMSISGSVGSRPPFRHRADLDFQIRGIAEGTIEVPSLISIVPDGYTFRFASAELGVEVHATRAVPSIAANGGVLLTTRKGEHFWIVDDIMSPFVGSLRIGGVALDLKGFTYSDRQWGDLPLQNHVSLWHWAHLVGDDQSTVLGVFHSREQRAPICRVLRYDRLKSSVTVDTREVDVVVGPTTLDFREAGGVTGRITRLDSDMIRDREERFADFHVRLRRWKSRGCLDRQTIYGMTETMEFRNRVG
jgi:hypothetical protein